MSDNKRTSAKAPETTETSETTAAVETNGTGAPTLGGSATTHWLAAGSAVIAIALVATLWTIKGGRLDSFGFSNTEVAEVAAPVATAPALAASAPIVTPVTAPLSLPATATAAQPSVSATVVPVATAPNGMPLFSAPHGVINPMTMMHDPRYYQQWGQVMVTFINPLAYQHIMNQMMMNSMQAWGLTQPITVSATVEGDPQG